DSGALQQTSQCGDTEFDGGQLFEHPAVAPDGRADGLTDDHIPVLRLTCSPRSRHSLALLPLTRLTGAVHPSPRAPCRSCTTTGPTPGTTPRWPLRPVHRLAPSAPRRPCCPRSVAAWPLSWLSGSVPAGSR